MSDVSIDSSAIERLVALAVEHHGAGRFGEAEACYRQALALDAHQGDALHGLGILEWQTERLEAARLHLREAVAIHPDIWRYSCTIGRFLLALGENAEAAEALERAKDLQPESPDLWFDLACVRQALGQLDAAVLAYRQTTELQPGNAEALNNLGVALGALGRREEAISTLRRGLAVHPANVPLHNNLGNALLGAGQIDDALAVFRQGLCVDANSAELRFNYANGLAVRSAGLETLEAYRRVLDVDPAHTRALVNLGNVLRLRGEFHEALARYEEAISQRPDFADAYNNAGVVLNVMGRIDEAIAAVEKAIALDPASSVAFNNLGNVYKNAARMEAAIASYRRAVNLDAGNIEAHSNLIYAMSFSPACDDRAILIEATRFAAAHCSPHATRVGKFARRDRSPERRLRIGYVSPDFRNHCQSLFTVPLLSHHDHQRFQIYCYAQLPHPDAISKRLATYADVWRPTYGMSDEGLAALIGEDEIDILVDLTMHMSNGRPLLFARKPAPLQVAWLAYPGTTGIPAIDYRLTDPWLDPPGTGDYPYSEMSIRLPDTFWCYDPLTDDLHPNSLPAATAGHVTFGCLNNLCKVSDDTLHRWGRVMARLPSSRLILLAAEGSHRQRVLDLLGHQYGVGAERIDFVPYQPRQQYLQTYHRIDLCLDTLPYNGHTTSLDAYWMGVPVVTQVGHTIVGRAGWSQLNNLGLPELAAFDDESFVDIAVLLAKDLARLAQLRQSLRGTLEKSSLMDGRRFAGAMQSAFRQMWERYRLMPLTRRDHSTTKYADPNNSDY